MRISIDEHNNRQGLTTERIRGIDMFDTNKVARVIRERRIDKNLTQIQLAEAMGVSYQAVSSWEHGNTMPDISKLEELTKLLGCSYQELLSDKDEEEQMSVNAEMDASFDEKEDNEITIGEMCGIAAFTPPDLLGQMAERVKSVESVGELCGIAAFLKRETLDRLAEMIPEVESAGELSGLAAFLSKETLGKMIDRIKRKEGDGSMTPEEEEDEWACYQGFFPFLATDKVAELVRRHMKL